MGIGDIYSEKDEREARNEARARGVRQAKIDDVVVEVCAICERAKIGGRFIAGPLPSDPFAYVGSKIVVCPDCLRRRELPAAGREGRK
jgi:hypothetical protein